MQPPIGNISLLDRHKIGFLAASHVAPLAVLPTLDWAAQVAQREDVAVMSGFSSQTERDVLSFLTKGKCGIILVLARCHYKQLPEEWQLLLDSKRLLIISTSNNYRQNKVSAYQRNSWICEHATNIVVPAKTDETSSLFELLKRFSAKIIYLDNPHRDDL